MHQRNWLEFDNDKKDWITIRNDMFASFIDRDGGLIRCMTFGGYRIEEQETKI